MCGAKGFVDRGWGKGAWSSMAATKESRIHKPESRREQKNMEQMQFNHGKHGIARKKQKTGNRTTKNARTQRVKDAAIR